LVSLKDTIENIQKTRDEISKSWEPVAELIEQTNILRESEHMKKLSKVNSLLIDAYQEYVGELESTILESRKKPKKTVRHSISKKHKKKKRIIKKKTKKTVKRKKTKRRTTR